MRFTTWLRTFNAEKGIDRDEPIEVEGPSGTNYLTIGAVFDAIGATSKVEQKRIQTQLVRLDFANANVREYYRHLAKALAI